MTRLKSLIILLAVFAVGLSAALSPADLFALTAAQQTAADNLETDLDARLLEQAQPGETAFALAADNAALDDDPLVRDEVQSRYEAASPPWSKVQWQQTGATTWLLILVN